MCESRALDRVSRMWRPCAEPALAAVELAAAGFDDAWKVLTIWMMANDVCGQCGPTLPPGYLDAWVAGYEALLTTLLSAFCFEKGNPLFTSHPVARFIPAGEKHAGTFLWHAHAKSLRAEGMAGALIVAEASEPKLLGYHSELPPLMLQEWWHGAARADGAARTAHTHPLGGEELALRHEAPRVLPRQLQDRPAADDRQRELTRQIQGRCDLTEQGAQPIRIEGDRIRPTEAERHSPDTGSGGRAARRRRTRRRARWFRLVPRGRLLSREPSRLPKPLDLPLQLGPRPRFLLRLLRRRLCRLRSVN